MTDLANDIAIEAMAHRVLDAALPKPEWTHAAHFALALYILRWRPELAQPGTMRRIITRLNEAHGTPNTDNAGYHHTITIASIKAAQSVLSRFKQDEPLSKVLEDLLALPFGNFEWIFAYWSPELLFSVNARRGWVAPDRQDLPF